MMDQDPMAELHGDDLSLPELSMVFLSPEVAPLLAGVDSPFLALAKGGGGMAFIPASALGDEDATRLRKRRRLDGLDGLDGGTWANRPAQATGPGIGGRYPYAIGAQPPPPRIEQAGPKRVMAGTPLPPQPRRISPEVDRELEVQPTIVPAEPKGQAILGQPVVPWLQRDTAALRPPDTPTGPLQVPERLLPSVSKPRGGSRSSLRGGWVRMAPFEVSSGPGFVIFALGITVLGLAAGRWIGPPVWSGTRGDYLRYEIGELQEDLRVRRLAYDSSVGHGGESQVATLDREARSLAAMQARAEALNVQK